MKQKTKWTRKCPRCKRTKIYKTKQGFDRATKNNSLCIYCVGIGRKLTVEIRNKISKSHIGISPNNKGKTYDDYYGIDRANEIKQIMSLKKRNHIPWNKGIPCRPETKLKLRNSLLGCKGPNKNKVFSNESKLKMRLSAIKRIEEHYGIVFPNYNKNSILILEQKAKELGITDLQHAENGGEFYIKELGYWVDGYSKEKNTVIEYYEKHHEKQKEKDKRRKKEIIKHLKCKFIEIKEIS